MKIAKHPLLAGSALALCLALGAGGNAQSAAPASGPASCKAIVPGIRCFDKLHALCTAMDGSAVPPLAQRDKDEMISAVVEVSTQIHEADLEQAVKDMDGLLEKLDQLRYAADTKISDADSEKIGVALSAASFCIDGLN